MEKHCREGNGEYMRCKSRAKRDIPDAQFSVFEAFLVQSVRLQGEVPCPNVRAGRALLIYQSFEHLQLIPVVGQFFQVKRAIVAELVFLSRPSE